VDLARPNRRNRRGFQFRHLADFKPSPSSDLGLNRISGRIRLQRNADFEPACAGKTVELLAIPLELLETILAGWWKRGRDAAAFFAMQLFQLSADKFTVSEQDVLREFLLESTENLNRLDSEIIELEQKPADKELLASVFRTIHTIKGTCGFLGFPLLERIAHQAESLLSLLRSGERRLSPRLVAVILECVDAIRKILANLEATEKEGPDEYGALIKRLTAAIEIPEDSPEVPPPAEAAPVETEKNSSVSESAIRVDVGLLDKLMNLVGELVLARNQVLQFTTQKEDGALTATAQRLNLITTELQENVMKTRMQPIGVVWNKLPRLVRDTANACGKLVRLDLDGAGTELDKTIIEAIKDPLTHLVRNCCDHGIETAEERARAGKPPHGVVSLKAYHEGGQVNIEVADDGAGVDVVRIKVKALEKGLIRPEQAERMSEHEAMHLMFLPGFSTAKTVTNVSGRGVGLDVVRCNIERIGGTVDVTSTKGKGTLIRLKIPLTLAIIPGLVAVSGGERFLIPQASLLELLRLEGDSAGKIERVHGTPVYRRRGRLLPVAFLNQVLGLKSAAEDDVVNIVVLQAEDRQFGLVVDGIKDTQEIVVKPLGKQLKGLTVYSGATIMGDGRVALILDVLGIGQRSGVLVNRETQNRTAAQAAGSAGSDTQRMLLFRAGSFSRLALPLSLVARLEEFPQAMVERAGGRLVVQYRGGILTLVSLASVLEPGSESDSAVTHDPIQAIVVADGQRSLGILVDQILDVVDESVKVRQSTSRLGLLGSAVVGKEVSDFLDLRAVVQAAAPEWLERQAAASASVVLLAEPSSFIRSLVRGELEMAGHCVVEASSAEEALSRIEGRSVGLVLAATNLPPGGCAGLKDAMRQKTDLAEIPVIELAPSAAGREAMLTSIAQLASALVSRDLPVPAVSVEGRA
jgi:two-component system chemotaxis sensor kinase CheA